MKKSFLVLSVISSLVALSAPLGTPLIANAFIENQFEDTYYATLNSMYKKLQKTEGKKIVFVGNSGVAFGINSSLIEETLKKSHKLNDYKVCNFGLYGVLGTKLMLDLSLNYINKDDIVIFMPELYENLLTLYFNPLDTWYAFENDLSFLNDLPSDYRSEYFSKYYDYASKRFNYAFKGEKAKGSGIYSSLNFDENCNLVKGDRNYNEMSELYDTNTILNLDEFKFNDEFVTYVNEYFAKIYKKGAMMYFGFCPFNKLALKKENKTIEQFENIIDETFKFPILGSLNKHIYDAPWFFDSNFHLNLNGCILNSINMIEEIKSKYGDTSVTEIGFPSMPEIPDKEVGKGDNEFVNYFEYEELNDAYIIKGIKEKMPSEITIPYSYKDKRIIKFKSDVFKNNQDIKKITLQDNITSLEDNSFNGATNLEGIYLEHSSPSKISVGMHLMDGCNAKIYVKSRVYDKFINNYFWSNYGDKLDEY